MEGANTTVMKFAESCSLGWGSGFLPNEQGKFFCENLWWNKVLWEINFLGGSEKDIQASTL